MSWAGMQKADIDAIGRAGVRHNPNLAAQLPGGWTNYGEHIAVNFHPRDHTQLAGLPRHNTNMLSPALDAFGSAQLDIFDGNCAGVQIFTLY